MATPSRLERGRASDSITTPTLTLPRMITTPDSKMTGGIPVYVMLPLDTVSSEGVLRSPLALEVGLRALKAAGVTVRSLNWANADLWEVEEIDFLQ